MIKLLRMTESDNDGEALTALRKANAFLRSAGWDWEKLVNSKIKIIEDPFKNLGTPPGGNKMSAPGFNQPMQPPPPRQPPPPPTQKKSWPLGIAPNRFAGWCYCCGVEVVANAGVIFKPYEYHAQAVNDWRVACFLCNGTQTSPGALVRNYPSPRRASVNKRGKVKPAVGDLS